MPVFSSFRRLTETPPAVATASFGAPFDFKFDVERDVELENGRGRSDRY